MKASAGKDFQALLARGFRATLAAVRQAAGKRCDHVVGRA
jgi:hypothetical protein